jgi:hypothetical protein
VIFAGIASQILRRPKHAANTMTIQAAENLYVEIARIEWSTLWRWLKLSGRVTSVEISVGIINSAPIVRMWLCASVAERLSADTATTSLVISVTYISLCDSGTWLLESCAELWCDACGSADDSPVHRTCDDCAGTWCRVCRTDDDICPNCVEEKLWLAAFASESKTLETGCFQKG